MCYKTLAAQNAFTLALGRRLRVSAVGGLHQRRMNVLPEASFLLVLDVSLSGTARFRTWSSATQRLRMRECRYDLDALMW